MGGGARNKRVGWKIPQDEISREVRVSGWSEVLAYCTTTSTNIKVLIIILFGILPHISH